MFAGNNIQKFRKEFNMTQEELAAKLGVSKATVSKYENNEIAPSCKNLKKLAIVFDISVNELFDEVDYKSIKTNKIKEPKEFIGMSWLPYMNIYEDENGDVVIYNSSWNEAKNFSDYSGGTILTSFGDILYIIDTTSKNGEQFVCGKCSIGEILEQHTLSEL